MNEKPFWKSKTFWVQAATIAAGIFTILAESDLIKQNPTLFLVVTTVLIPVINLFVRTATTTGIKWSLRR